MSEEFIFGKGYQEPYLETNSLRILMIPTRYGKVVACEVSEFDGYKHNRFIVVPGIYISDLEPTESGLRRIEVEPVENKSKEDILNTLRNLGYRVQVDFW
jgi:hypothetical protein